MFIKSIFILIVSFYCISFNSYAISTFDNDIKNMTPIKSYMLWTQRTSNTSNWLYKLAYSGKQVVAVGGMGTIISSADGIIWTTRDSGTKVDLYGIIWSGDRFVAVGEMNTILTSYDGIIWKTVYSEEYEGPLLRSVASLKNKIVAIGNPNIFFSDNTTEWTSKSSYGITEGLYAITSSDTQFIAVGIGGKIITSPDGTNWVNRISNTNEALKNIIWTKKGFIAVGSSGTIVTSIDGITWTKQFSGTTIDLYSIIWTGKEFIAVGDVGSIFVSPDGKTWKGELLGMKNLLTDVILVEKQLVLTGSWGILLTYPLD